MQLDAMLWILLPVFIAAGSALLAYYIMHARMEVAIARERSRLAALLRSDSGLDAMRSALCREIACGALTLEQPALREHLRATAMERMAVDQPGYSAYIAGLARRHREQK